MTNYTCGRSRCSVRLLDVLDDRGNGHLPCLVFERGDETLAEFMQKTTPNAFMKNDVLLQVRWMKKGLEFHGMSFRSYLVDCLC